VLRVPLSSLLLSGVVAVIVVLVFTLRPWGPDGASGQATNTQQAGFELAIDADADNGTGPCYPIDSEAFVDVGTTHRVAVCLVNPPEPPFAFFTQVIYDGQLEVAPDVVPCTSPALDCNPDANAGATTFSSPDLGARWDCTGLTVFLPTGDDPYTPDVHDASIACNGDLRNPDTTLVDGGPLNVVTLNAIGRGDDHLEFSPETHLAGAAAIMGRCGTSKIPEETIPCHGAVIHIGEKSQSQPTTAPSGASPVASPGAPTPSGTPAAVATRNATPAASQVTSEADQEGGFPWPVLGGALGGLLVLAVVVGGLYAWRRGARGRT
jgi:hypothetical protein